MTYLKLQNKEVEDSGPEPLTPHQVHLSLSATKVIVNKQCTQYFTQK